jgi:NRPS condensation-like uncharacterized protein
MLRKLGIFERAMLITNQHAPFIIVSVLRMEHAPSPDVVKDALETLQKRQPFLRVRVADGRFESLPSLGFPFISIQRTDPDQWRDVTEKEMAFRYDPITGPLFRAIYLYGDGCGDLILNVHHSIMDAASGMNLLDELLRLCSGEVTNLPTLEPAPALEKRFPPSYQGLRRVFNLGNFALMQMGDMLRFTWRTRGKRTPPVRLGGQGHIATLVLPEELVDSLSHQGRKEGVTLNSLMNAALVLATNRHLYGGEAVPMQTFAFADLRPYTKPPMGPEQLANYISMLRFTMDVSGEKDFWDLARELHAKIYRALKQGDKFSASLMSESLMKMFIALKSMRMGSTALNYSGVVPLKTQYGEIKVVGLHGFVSGLDLGPEMASQARLFNDQIWWDFIYLDTDMDAELAGKIIGEVKAILEEAGRGSD